MLPSAGPPAGPPAGGRARPLPPDERRAMLIAATLPLVAEHGTKVTTRQIAQAAGVAEGTIFRVFPDKDALVRAAVDQAMDPLPTVAVLGAIDRDLPLRERLVEVTAILQRQLIQVFHLLINMGLHRAPKDVDAHRRAGRSANELIVATIAALLEPDRDRFRCPVEQVVRLLRLLTFSGSHPMITDGNLLTAEEIVSVVLDGVLRVPEPTHDNDNADEPGERPC